MPLNSNSIFQLPAGRHLDGDGLYLNVGASGRRSWQLRIKVSGKATMISIGALPAMGLMAARQRAKQLTLEAMQGKHPKPAKGLASALPQMPVGGVKVAEVWNRYAMAMLESGEWTEMHHRRTNLQVNKHMGAMASWHEPAGGLARVGIVSQCEQIESREMRQRIFRWWRAAHEEALNAGLVTNNVFPRVLPKALARPTSDKGTLAGSITDIDDLKELLNASWCCDAALSIRAAHRVVALTGQRIGAVLLSKVDAYDPQADTFTLPRENMKMRDLKHADDVVIAPLSPKLREALRQTQERAVGIKSGWLFPNLSGAQPVLNESVIKHLNRIRPEGSKFTPHSWRSVIMTWGLDAGFSRDVMQVALDHARGTDADRHYDRSTMRVQVAEMLLSWANTICV
jgi:integrase